MSSSGKPVVSTLTEPDGSYLVRGLEADNYSAYAEPIDEPLTAAGVSTLGQVLPSQTPNVAFTTRFAVVTGTASTLMTLTKIGGDSQTGIAGQALPQPLEVMVRDGNGVPVSGNVVRFAAASGGGTVIPIQTTTDSQGRARTTSYLGKHYANFSGLFWFGLCHIHSHGETRHHVDHIPGSSFESPDEGSHR